MLLECVSNIDDLDSPAPPPPYFKAFGGYWNATQVFLKHALLSAFFHRDGCEDTCECRNCFQIPSVHFGFKGQCASPLKLTSMKEM